MRSKILNKNINKKILFNIEWDPYMNYFDVVKYQKKLKKIEEKKRQKKLEYLKNKQENYKYKYQRGLSHKTTKNINRGGGNSGKTKIPKPPKTPPRGTPKPPKIPKGGGTPKPPKTPPRGTPKPPKIPKGGGTPKPPKTPPKGTPIQSKKSTLSKTPVFISPPRKPPRSTTQQIMIVSSPSDSLVYSPLSQNYKTPKKRSSYKTPPQPSAPRKIRQSISKRQSKFSYQQPRLETIDENFVPLSQGVFNNTTNF
jgi:hypothetical protein